MHEIRQGATIENTFRDQAWIPPYRVLNRCFKSLMLPAFLLGLLGGCSLIHTTVDIPVRMVKAVLPGGQETELVDPIELQEDMLRFADNFVLSTSKGAEFLTRNQQSIKRSELLTIKVALASDVYGIASGSNALANLVGLTVLATGARHRVEDYWLPKVYGSSAQPLLNSLRDREREIWTIAERVLTREMIAELHEAIDKWRVNSSEPNGDLEAFASNSLVNDVTKGFEKNRPKSLPSSVFALLDLDPLAGLDPATRELTETRLFAERALFMGQRLPQLIEWQMELLALRSVEIPEFTSIVQNSSTIAGSGERLSKSFESLPAFLSAERERLLKAFTQERSGLVDLAHASKETFTEGTEMAKATDQAFKSYDIVLQHLNTPPPPGVPPFDVREWGQAASEINHMSVELQSLFNLVLSISETDRLAGISAVSRETGEALVDYAFRKLLLLIILSGLFITAFRLGYLWIRARWLPSAH
jgi:hypothetical protein